MNCFDNLKNKKVGFTVIEIVAVIALSTLIFGIIYQVYDSSQNIFKQSDSTLELAQNGRVILDRLSRELRQANVVATPLPADKNQMGFPPANSLLFEDGHDQAATKYLRYIVQNSQMHRQVIVYSFPANPNIYVHYDAIDQNNNSPQETILEDRIIAEYVSNIQFYGPSEVTIELDLVKNNYPFHLITTIWGRNTNYGQN